MDNGTSPAPMSPMAKEALRQVTRLLDTNFDQARGRYLNGYSDARIAEEVGISTQAVRTEREEGWGVLKIDEALQAMTDDVGAMATMVKQVRADWSKVESTIASSVAAIESMQRDLETKLHKLLHG
jgi:uncharacterized protein YjcR